MSPKRKSTPFRNPLHSGESTSSDPTPSSVRFRDNKAQQDFSENFSRQGVHSKCQVILSNFSNTDLATVIHSRGWESLCDVPITCQSVLKQEFYSNMHGFDYSVPFFVTHVRGTHIVVTSDIVFEVLHVSRVEHLDYPNCDRLRTVSTDWGDRQFTSCTAFAKGPRFLNMVMTFVLHPLSHYNSFTESRAQFLLSLLEHLIIDFLSHFILSIIYIYRDMATRNKLIFPSAITRISRHFSIPFPISGHFHVMCVIDDAIVKQSET